MFRIIENKNENFLNPTQVNIVITKQVLAIWKCAGCKKDNEMEENFNCIPPKIIHNEKNTLIFGWCSQILDTNFMSCCLQVNSYIVNLKDCVTGLNNYIRSC